MATTLRPADPDRHQDDAVSPDDVVLVVPSNRPRRTGSRSLPTRPRSWPVLALASVVVVGFLLIVTSQVADVIARKEAMQDGVRTADLAAESVVRPHLTDAALRGEPQALAELNRLVTVGLLRHGVMRIKVFDDNGRIVYSDEPRLIGQRFGLDPVERAVLTDGVTRAAITRSEGGENRYEAVDTLLEVRRPVTSLSGRRLLLEIYTDYEAVESQARRLWLSIGPLVALAVVLVVLLMAPVVWWMSRRLRDAQEEREAALLTAVEAGESERRQIAATLHDGPVQELIGVSMLLSNAADRAAGTARGDDGELRRTLDLAADVLRRTTAGMRGLLVELRPPSETDDALPAALEDLARPLRVDGLDVLLDVEDLSGVNGHEARAARRVVAEALRNVRRHADASYVHVTGTSRPATVTISDDGRGFDPTLLPAKRAEGHVGVALLTEAAQESGAGLTLRTAPGRGTTWTLYWPDDAPATRR